MSSSLSSSSSSSSSSSLSYLRPPVAALKQVLDDFVQKECIPAEAEWDAHLQSLPHGHEHERDNVRFTAAAIPPCMERLKNRAKTLGLWNLFIPQRLLHKIPIEATMHGHDYVKPSIVGGLTYREYGIFCESLGHCPHLAPEACNCSAPDTGNMEVLLEFGTSQQQAHYLIPLLRGEIRSTFLMTEPNVASSDATNLETRLVKTINNNNSNNNNNSIEYILQGEKWWSSGAMDPRCRLALVVAKMDYSQQPNNNNNASSKTNNNNNNKHGAHTIVAVPLPHPSVEMKRPLTVFGYDDAPVGHAHVILHNVRGLYESDLILGEGSGFRVAQARLGPGRIHHCMRAIGMAARSFELMLQRSTERKTFGRYLHEHGMTQAMIADSFADLQAARLLTLHCAAVMDDAASRSSSSSSSNKEVRAQIAMIKATVPEMTLRIVDRAIQVFGGAGVCQDYCLARFWAMLRTLRIADGPDAVHKRTVARLAIQKLKQQQEQQQQFDKSRL